MVQIKKLMRTPLEPRPLDPMRMFYLAYKCMHSNASMQVMQCTKPQIIEGPETLSPAL
jgi:hypothetical protein